MKQKSIQTPRLRDDLIAMSQEKYLKKNNIFPCYALLKMSWMKQESTKSPN